jgi:putative heme-binding domain-containing protein
MTAEEDFAGTLSRREDRLGYFAGMSWTVSLGVEVVVLAMAMASTQAGAGDHGPFALTHSGRAAEGRRVFNDEKAACAKCHSVDGSAQKVGPDLLAVAAKFSRAELIKAILEPSDSIAVGYAATLISTVSGEDFSGVVKRAPAEMTELMLGDGQKMQIPAGEISERRISPVSLMPEGLQQGLSHEEFADLIAYLLTLRPAANVSAAQAGVLVSTPMAEKEATFTPYFPENIRFQNPTWFGEAPGQTNLYLALESVGKIWAIERNGSAAAQRVFVDLSRPEYLGPGSGLLTCAFHPRFAETRKYYLKYQRQKDRIHTVIEERQFTPDFRGDAGAARIILEIPCTTQFHTGGAMAFGPDGFLYVGMGDSGPQRDPRGNGQNLGTLLGKILRIDVDKPAGALPYSIPADNPFRERPGARAEVWAYGFREPWRMSFDRETGDLWVGDVGQDRVEEIGIARAGENHGWNVYEGFERFSETFRRAEEQYRMPIFAYLHSVGVSITGGYVYRGERTPALRGYYICADFEARRVWALTQTNRALGEIIQIGFAPSRPVSFSQGRDGELYVLGHDSGQVYHVDLSSVDTTPLKRQVLAATSEESAALWRMTLSKPADDWHLPEFNDRGWTNAAGGFGTADTPGALVGTEWRTPNIWLRREFQLPDNFTTQAGRQLVLRVHHDEDAVVYLNGLQVARHPRSTSEYIELPLSDEAARALRPGRNFLAIQCRQTRGPQYIDAGLVEYLKGN